MKTTTRLALSLAFWGGVAVPAAFALVSPGSFQGKGLKLYMQHYGTAPKTETGRTLDCKIVSYGDKTLVWTRQSGNVAADNWASQFRVYTAPGEGNKTEYNLTGRSADGHETWGTARVITLNSVLVSVFQSDNNEMYETDLFDYYVTKANNPVEGDHTAPVAGDCTVDHITAQGAVLNLSATDENDYFYVIRDLSRGIKEVSLDDSFELTNLSPETEYRVEIIPIDFSGNEGESKTLVFTTGKFTQICTGTAKAIRFFLVSTEEKLEYYYEFADGHTLFHDAFLKDSTDGGASFKEVKPAISPDRTYCYGVIDNDRDITGKLLTLNMGYMAYQSGPNIDWGQYVVTNTEITEGPLKGSPIRHQMGEVTEGDSERPVIRSAALADITDEYCSLTLDGEDESGAVYYEVLSDGQKIHLFRTGTSSFTGLTAGQLHVLKILAKDAGGNASADTLEVNVRTAAKRSSVGNNDRLNYNSATKPSGKGGEIATVIEYDASTNKLILGCTTQNGMLQDNRQAATFDTADDETPEGQRPTITINGTDYVLSERHVTEMDNTEGITTAMLTFDGRIGETELVPGRSLTLKWAVSWSSGGRFFTAPFEYVTGDDGRADVTGPSTPELREINKSGDSYTVSWDACNDDLLGVKGYEVVINRADPYMIFNLDEESYSIYPMPDDNIEVTAVDYAGNRSETAVIGGGSNVQKETENRVFVILSGDRLSVQGTPIHEVCLYTVEGRLQVRSTTPQMDITGLNPGVYVVKVYGADGQFFITKVRK